MTMATPPFENNFSGILQGAANKVIPCRIFQIFKQPLRIFSQNSVITFFVHTDT